METVENSKNESTVKDFLEVIFRRKWVIIGIVLFSLLMVIFLNMREPALYESTSTMLVKRGQPEGVFNQYVRTMPWEEEIASQIEMVKSQIVIESAQEKLSEYLPDDYSSIPSLSTANVEAGVVSTSNVIWVKYVSSDPFLCEAAVNAITNAYREHYAMVKTPPEMDDFFSEELKILKEEIEYWRERKVVMGEKWGLVNIEKQEGFILQRLEQYYSDYDDIVNEKKQLAQIIEKLIEAGNGGVKEMYGAYDSYLASKSKTTNINNLYDSFIELEMEKDELSTKYTDSNKELIEIRSRLDNVEEMLNEEMEILVKVKKTKLEVLENREKLLSQLIGNLESEKNSFSRKEVEVSRINSTLSRVEKSYNELLNKQMAARISMASNPEWKITILTHATDASRQKTRDYVRIALGPFFSLLFSIGFAFFIDNLDHSIKNVAEAEDILEINVLASFPDTETK
ncbi:MAG TPA: hypothetical protein VKO43_06565 [Candidatus Krumholzibacteriaceae bacterium]|nr:hypothetical protein [Candidatus Krumholzibacteriaceae bacterium]